MNKEELKNALLEKAEQNIVLLENNITSLLEEDIGGGEVKDLNPMNSLIRDYKKIMHDREFDEHKINFISSFLLGMFEIMSKTYSDAFEHDNGNALFEYICNNYDIYKGFFKIIL